MRGEKETFLSPLATCHLNILSSSLSQILRDLGMSLEGIKMLLFEIQLQPSIPQSSSIHFDGSSPILLTNTSPGLATSGGCVERREELSKQGVERMSQAIARISLFVVPSKCWKTNERIGDGSWVSGRRHTLWCHCREVACV